MGPSGPGESVGGSGHSPACPGGASGEFPSGGVYLLRRIPSREGVKPREPTDWGGLQPSLFRGGGAQWVGVRALFVGPWVEDLPAQHSGLGGHMTSIPSGWCCFFVLTLGWGFPDLALRRRSRVRLVVGSRPFDMSGDWTDGRTIGMVRRWRTGCGSWPFEPRCRRVPLCLSRGRLQGEGLGK